MEKKKKTNKNGLPERKEKHKFNAQKFGNRCKWFQFFFGRQIK